YVPRKFSKTTFVAAIAIYDLMFGDCNAQCYTAANSYKQAKVCMDMIKYILKRLDPKSKSFKRVKEIVTSRLRGRDSKIECVSNSPDKLDGLMCSTVIVDEYSQADDSALYDVLTTSMGTRKNPLTIVITTASDKQDTPFLVMLEHYKRILLGSAENDHVFAHLFMPDEGDDDYGNEELWKKVHPHYGVTVYPEFYKSEWAKAQSSAVYMKAFLTKLLNVFCNFGKEWVSADAVKRVTKHVDVNDYRGYETMVSVDLSVSDDFSSLNYAIYDRPNREFVNKTYYFIPRGTMERHPNSSLYRDMVAQGHMVVIEGDVIDYQVLIDNIVAHTKILNILQVGYDAYKSLEFINTLSAMFGAKYLVPIKQTIAAFTAPTEIVEKGIYDKRIYVDDNPLNLYCFNNVQIIEDNIGNRKPMKKSENSKIDGVITIIMGSYLFNNFKR
ncbi:MAG: terminase TerL endonuclease subunit, partial [Tannerellaceae bacterium]